MNRLNMNMTAATRTNTTMMAAKVKSKKAKRKQRHERQRRNIYGTEERPRLAVYKSNEHIYAQVIDDSKNEGKGHTLCAVSTLTPSLRKDLESGANKEAASKVGASIAEKCKALDINTVIFDKGGFIYHGRVKAVAEAAREGGLKF
mmetsp:Transcript_7740/g.14451  ORF Transcript_7740/g.14451 Transcript_7740/m.14451 type:complete len:146 (-) Transcript_7740:92-529(-)|eukprot:CAMPEP_0197471480 /NCGR_PEP_ID=MMETSP1309-20131121/2433_1 /TAXON_ID=464262 /ORGANISM="Genus nov. species nov., Strain RCC998" /LENGTH=145 /DNA_ID=CAMNT_0043009247 /DNA_START=104 /DNA_END=541 /DNA_ORIENTATION=+